MRSGTGLWKEGSRLDALDKRCSSPIFHMRLSYLSELAMSVPGAFMGFPQAFLGPTPLTLASLTHLGLGIKIPAGLLRATAGVWIVGLLAFYGGLARKFSAKAATLATIVFMTPCTATALSRLYHPARAAGCQSLCSAMLTVAVCVPLKAAFHRSRPAVSLGFIKDVEQRRSGMFATYIKEMCAGGQRLDAMPSADVAIAGANAALFWRAGYPVLGAVLVAGSAFGRMYLWAHHLLDVVAGFSAGVCITEVLRGFGWGGCLGDVAYTYLVFMASLVFLAKRSKRIVALDAVPASDA